MALKAVTFGPFPEWWDRDPGEEFARIRRAGFNAIRVYERPDRAMLDLALEHELWVIVTLPWSWGRDFCYHHELFDEALAQQAGFLQELGNHPALALLLVANEIPPDMVRWMGAVRVRESLEQMIREARRIAPDVLYGYANFPTTEYLEPANADVTCFNVFLENQTAFEDYIAHLHVVAGDRPLMLGEIGLDTQSHDEERQREILEAQFFSASREGVAGVTVYAWSDAWQNNGREMTEWSFGLTRRDGSEKPALLALQKLSPMLVEVRPQVDQGTMISVIVCVYNGASRIADCLESLQKVNYRNYEVIVVDDGSEDESAAVAEEFDGVKVLREPHRGLSAARNAGARAAKGAWLAYTDDDCVVDEDWLGWAARLFRRNELGAIGGPNLVPQAKGWQEAAVESASGGPSHVLTSDTLAEHIPGCHFMIRRSVLLDLGGFDKRFTSAGDDVDLCWRLLDGGWKIGFAPQSYVIHRRRLSLWKYVKQQRGYGRAERALLEKWPQKFTRSGQIEWSGVIYSGAAARVSEGAFIYHGAMGAEPFQSLAVKVMPLRPLRTPYDQWWVRLGMRTAENVARLWRDWERSGAMMMRRARRSKRQRTTSRHGKWRRYSDDLVSRDRGMQLGMWAHESAEGLTRWDFLKRLRDAGWTPIADDMHWDLGRRGARLLIATEQSSENVTTTLFRLEAHADEYERREKRVRGVLGG